MFNRNLLYLLIFLSAHSYGRFLVEPSYNYYTGKFKAGSETGHLTGRIYGLNLGYLGERFMMGISIETGQYDIDDNATPFNTRKFDGGGVGTFLGFHLWDRFKVWTGYLNSTLEPTNNNDQRYFGQHVSYGLGYRLIDGLMFNIYEFKNQYTQLEDDITGKTNGLDVNIKTTGMQYSLSYILVF